MSDPLSRFRHLELPEKEAEDSFAEQRKAELESGIEVAPADAEQPFVRCPFCEADNARFAVKCVNCAHGLQTDEVRAWNQAFWAERRAQMHDERSRDVGEEQRKLAEAVEKAALKAAEAAAEEERVASLYTSFGTRMLGRIEDPAMRNGVTLGLVGLFVWAVYSLVNPRLGTGQHFAGLAVVIALGAAFGTLRHFRK